MKLSEHCVSVVNAGARLLYCRQRAGDSGGGGGDDDDRHDDDDDIDDKTLFDVAVGAQAVADWVSLCFSVFPPLSVI